MSIKMKLQLLQPVKRTGFIKSGCKLFNTSRSRFLAEEAKYATIPPPPPPRDMFLTRARAILLTGISLTLSWVFLVDRRPDWGDVPVPMENALGISQDNKSLSNDK